MKRCQKCGSGFNPARPWQVYCSSYCRQLAFRGGKGPTYGEGLHVLRCPCCGASRQRSAFVKGALGRHEVALLTQHFTDKGIKWTKAKPNQEQLETVARAVVCAGERLRERLGDELPFDDPTDAVAATLADPDLSERDYAAILESFASVADPYKLVERLVELAQTIDTHLRSQ